MEGNLESSQYYHQVRFYTVPNRFSKSKEQHTNKSLLWILIVLKKQTGLCCEIENNDIKIMKFKYKYIDDLGEDLLASHLFFKHDLPWTGVPIRKSIKAEAGLLFV